MKEAKHLLSLISRFLRRNDNDAEKKELVDWYDRYKIGNEPTDEHIAKTGKAVKQTVLQSIHDEQRQKPIRRIGRPFMAAASLLLIMGLGYLWYTQSNQEIIASAEQLAAIQPANPQAKITLDNGEVIDLEKMPTNSRIKHGDTEIIKDSTGQIAYRQLELRTAKRSYSTMQTPANATYSVTLSDGTTVLLNANSHLKYPNSFGTDERIVELEGEAYFNVSKTKNNQRFLVKTKQQVTEVLGTTFNIKARDGETSECITLEKGVVQVRSNSSECPKLLVPGQQAAVSSTKIQIENIDIDAALAWTKGYFYLDGTNTAETLQEIAAWYDIDIKYTQTASKNNYKGKIPKNLPLNKLIELLEYTELKTKPILENDRVKLLIK